MEPPSDADTFASPAPVKGREDGRRQATPRGRRLALALGSGLGLVLFESPLVARGLTTDRFRNDYRLYSGAARVGLRYGFSRTYDFDLQRQAVEAAFKGANYQPFISPPVDAWLAAPLVGLPFDAGLAAWTLLLLASVLATWLLLAPGRGVERLAHLFLAAGFLPLGFAISVGQLAPVIGLGIAGSYVLAREERGYLAGAALVVVWLKPQDALLVAPALLVAGRWRPFAGWVAASAVLALASAATLGGEGIAQYRAALTTAGGWELMRHFSFAGQPAWGSAAPMVSLVVAAATLWLAHRLRRRLHLVFAAGLAGSLMFSPYLGYQDLALVIPAIWLSWQEAVPRWHLLVTVVLFAVLQLGLALGPVPVLAAEFSWFVALWLLPVGVVPASPSPGTGPAQGHPARRPGDPAPA